MNTMKNKLIEKFLNKVKNKYPKLYIECDYHEDDDLYEIWHNDANLEYHDEEFKKLIALNAQEILFDNNIFNFCFGYDHFKTLKLEELSYTLVNTNTSFKIQGKINNNSNLNKNNY